MNMYQSINNLTKFEKLLWAVSATVVMLSFLSSGNGSILSLLASLVGVTALIFVARGEVLGQVLTVLFSLLYAIISYNFRYYGEMITYIGMTAPIAMMSVVSWLKHPYKEGKGEVEVAHMSKGNLIIMVVLTIAVTQIFYYILAYFHTANLVISTISIATSFLASYLMLFRNPAYALAYGANDIVLISLWVLATMEDVSYLPMVVNFVMFFCNDMYGFYNWRKMRHRQSHKASYMES